MLYERYDDNQEARSLQQNSEASEETRYQCRHVFTSGHRCGSPALRGENFCYYHHTTRRPVQEPVKRRRRQARFSVPPPKDRSAIQLGIGQVLHKLAQNDLDPRRAGLLLYGLQIASLNLPKPKSKAKPDEDQESVAEITLDPTHGPIALPGEYQGPTGRKGSAELMLERLRQIPIGGIDESLDEPEPEDVWRD